MRFRDSIKRWTEKLFFVKVSELGKYTERMRRRESVKLTDHIPATREYDKRSVERIGSLMLNVRELQEPVLYTTALSPMPVEKVGQLIYGGKRRWRWRKIWYICE